VLPTRRSDLAFDPGTLEYFEERICYSCLSDNRLTEAILDFVLAARGRQANLVDVVEMMEEHKSDFAPRRRAVSQKTIPCEEVFYRPTTSRIQVMTSRPVPG
jgi:hypothetical protein